MSEFLVGNELLGTFKPSRDVGDISQYSLERMENSLYLKGPDRISLEPYDEAAANVIANFSLEVDDFNESIYRMYKQGSDVEVVLMTFVSVIRLDADGKSLVIHLRPSDEDNVIHNEEGLNGIKAGGIDEIPQVLADLFISHQSIFVFEGRNDNNKSFQMLGDGYVANILMERPGVYVIDRIIKPRGARDRNAVCSISQIFGHGNIRFVTSNQALSERGNDDSVITPVRTSEIFDAWQEYAEFQKRIYEEDLGKCLYPFQDLHVEGDRIRIHLERPLGYFEDGTPDLEFISTVQMKNAAEPSCQADDIIAFKKDNKEHPVYLGSPVSLSNDRMTVWFPFPYRGLDDHLIGHGGILYISDNDLRTSETRRGRVYAAIDSKKNPTMNMVMRLSDKGVVDYSLKASSKPVSPAVMKAMLGDPEANLTETYYRALDLAFNTPDIALIQGPPGTGKTTLITGLITRLSEKNKDNRNFHILVSSEQHEALKNVVSKIAGSELLPPFVSSTRHAADGSVEEADFEKNIEKFQERCLEVCDSILNESEHRESFSSLQLEAAFIFQDIEDKGYSKNAVLEHISELEDVTRRMDCSDKISDLRAALGSVSSPAPVAADDPDARMISQKINSQRTILSAFLGDDGRVQLIALQGILKSTGHADCLMDPAMQQTLISGTDDAVEDSFPAFLTYVDGLKDRFIQRYNPLDSGDFAIKDLVQESFRSIVEASRSRKMDFYDIIERFAMEISDPSTVAGAISRYTTVFGSTCAQAGKSTRYAELGESRYDYVIVDEAARANPLDIMIPLMLGTRVLLVGDQNQLPHYIETQVLKRMRDERSKFSDFDETLLSRSLFQLLYDNLETAYGDGRLKFPRTVMLDEQHRMHPVIGDFISREFYSNSRESLHNGPGTESNVNDFNVFGGKNIAVVDVPAREGLECKAGGSICRPVEKNAVLSVIKRLVTANHGSIPSMGIISFYKQQILQISESVRNDYPADVASSIDCNTVDSVQGKEYDVVILSGVRSNLDHNLGFIDYSDSRVNVSLSRAKRLLVFVGDTNTFVSNRHFSNLFDYVREVGCFEQFSSE